MDPLALADLRRTLTRASLATSKRMRRAEKEGTVLGEETLTEMMVLEILENLRHCREPFDIETYNHHQESQNGADLRIWLNLDDAFIGFSIQAKKAKLDAQQRVVASSLDHLVGRAKKRQVDILIARSVLDMTNPVHLVYQSPSLGARVGMNGGCYAMSSYLMNWRMGRYGRPVDKIDLRHYQQILFPWSTLVDPPSPGHLQVPLSVVPRSPRTHADLVNIFGSLGDDLGSRFYGARMGAFRYGLVAPPLQSAGAPDPDPKDGPNGGGDGPAGENGPDESQESESGRGSEEQVPRPVSEGREERRDPDQSGGAPAERREERVGAESLLFRSAPKRVIRLGEPMEVGEFGTPLSVVKQREQFAHLALPVLRADDIDFWR